MKLPLIAAVLGLAWSLGAGNANAASMADCFCTKQVDGGAPGKYKVFRRGKPECKDVKYDAKGRQPWEVGVGFCSGASKNSSKPDASPSSPELIRRCFCFKQGNKDGIQQIFVVSYPTVPQCKNARYKEVGTGAWDNTLPCDAAKNCKNETKKCEEKLEKLQKKATDKNQAKASKALNDIVALTKKCKAVEDFCYLDPINQSK